MANPWDNDNIKTPASAPAQAPAQAASGSPLTLDDMRSLFQEIVSSQRQPAAPASENPDRQFYQSGVTGSDRQFEPEVYSVQSGDTLTRIAAQNPFTLDQLKQANEGIDFDNIAIGQELKLPDMGAPVADTTTMPDSDEPMVPASAEFATEVAQEEEETATDSTTFATITKDGTSTTVEQTVPLTQGFDTLTESEGTNIHLDGRGFVTLPHGIVPDANSVKKADGTPFDPTGSHGLRAGSLSGVDYSEATKFGISRKDYSDDEAFAKAVYAEFGDRTSSQYGQGFDQLSDAAKQAAYDMAWNAGVGSASWSSVQTMLTEASKEDDNTKVTDNLIGFTTNFRSGSDYPRGLLKRRVQTYNLVAKEGEEATTITTSAVMENGERTGTKYEIKKSDGSVLKTWTKPDLNERLGDLAVG